MPTTWLYRKSIKIILNSTNNLFAVKPTNILNLFFLKCNIHYFDIAMNYIELVKMTINNPLLFILRRGSADKLKVVFCQINI